MQRGLLQWSVLLAACALYPSCHLLLYLEVSPILPSPSLPGTKIVWSRVLVTPPPLEPKESKSKVGPSSI